MKLRLCIGQFDVNLIKLNLLLIPQFSQHLILCSQLIIFTACELVL